MLLLRVSSIVTDHQKTKKGRVSKSILERTTQNVRGALKINAWKNTLAVIDWFQEIEKKVECTFMLFDIVEFYTSISEDLLKQALEFAATYTAVTEKEEDIILH